MLNWLRGRISGLQGSLGRAASSLMPNPSAWTAVGFLLSTFAGVAYWAGPPWTGGILLLASGFIDIVDGAVARATGRVSSAGAFLDSTLDRFAEVAAYTGIAASFHVPSVIVLLALSLSLTVSYLRARFESLSNERPRGLELGERAERLLALGILSLLGFLEVGVLLVLALALETNIERFVLYRRVLSGRTGSMVGNS
ncbi:MAG: CDP-alcohol phosphatidyltransferase family protein [Conexivisphaera sp.]|nr:CDP-alcohol phosphatidyltransferase family protein [Conexivisphaerales archaeon]